MKEKKTIKEAEIKTRISVIDTLLNIRVGEERLIKDTIINRSVVRSTTSRLNHSKDRECKFKQQEVNEGAIIIRLK